AIWALHRGSTGPEGPVTPPRAWTAGRIAPFETSEVSGAREIQARTGGCSAPSGPESRGSRGPTEPSLDTIGSLPDPVAASTPGTHRFRSPAGQPHFSPPWANSVRSTLDHGPHRTCRVAPAAPPAKPP